MIKIFIVDDDVGLRTGLNKYFELEYSAKVQEIENSKNIYSHTITEFIYHSLQISIYYFLDTKRAEEALKMLAGGEPEDYFFQLMFFDLKFDIYDNASTKPMDTSGYKMLLEMNRRMNELMHLKIEKPYAEVITSLPLHTDDVIAMRKQCNSITIKNSQYKDSSTLIKSIIKYLDSRIK